jgi:hypothetical protein
MEPHRMPQDIIFAEYHGTFYDTTQQQDALSCSLTFETSWIKREGTKEKESSIYVYT